MRKEEFSSYWCQKCRRHVTIPKWREVKFDVASGHCPQCGGEICRKLK